MKISVRFFYLLENSALSNKNTLRDYAAAEAKGGVAFIRRIVYLCEWHCDI